MKVAHLILAHKNPHQVSRLIESLSHPSFDFYIHIDKKVDAAPFKTLLQHKRVFLINKRASIHWGGWGTIQATLNGFELLVNKGYDYINVISGQDFPVKPASYIYNYFEQHRGKEFITCDRIEGDWADVASRIKNYHLINWKIPGKFTLEKIITRVLPARKFPFPFEIVGRANWFTLSNEAVSYALEFLQRNSQMTRYFKLCWGADEFIFSTILYNSPFKQKIVDNLVHVNWNGTEKGHPKLMDTGDINELKQTPKLFARKFDMKVDSAIFDMLEDMNTSSREELSIVA